ncbi:hypothetical protein MHYP_G00337990 [Metynnis hypsauchen]
MMRFLPVQKRRESLALNGLWALLYRCEAGDELRAQNRLLDVKLSGGGTGENLLFPRPRWHSQPCSGVGVKTGTPGVKRGSTAPSGLVLKQPCRTCPGLVELCLPL